MRPLAPDHASSATRVIALTIAAGGGVLVLLSALADQIGIGDGEGFGWKQLIGVIVGLVVLLLGLAWGFPHGPSGGPDDLPEPSD